MEEIPDLPLERILQMTDIESRKSVRNVCARWKQEIEGNQKISLAVIIDDRCEGLLEFIEKVSIKEANIKYLRCTNSVWFNLRFDEVKTLIFTGYVNPDFLTKNLLNPEYWNHLTKLFFYGTALISQLFNEAKPTTDLNPSTRRLFPSLLELHLVVAMDTHIQAKQQLSFAHLTGEIRVPDDTPPAGAQNFMAITLNHRMQRNAVALMTNIQGCKLHTLVLSLGSKSSFPLEALIDFIERHSKTLERLILPAIARTWTLPPLSGDQDFCWPTKLKTLCLAQVLIQYPSTARVGIELLLAQTALEEVLLSYSQFCISRFIPTVNTLFSKNLRTLKIVIIRSEWIPEGEGRVELDLKVFGSSECLEVLRLVHKAPGKRCVFYPVEMQPPCWHEGRPCACNKIRNDIGAPQFQFNFYLKNINCLPVSLKVFETSFSTTDDFDGVRFMREMVNLEEIKLTSVHRKGFMETRENISEYIQTALRHRKLNLFETEFSFSNEVVPDIGGDWDLVRRVVMDTFNFALGVMGALISTCKDNSRSYFLFESFYIGGMYPECVSGEHTSAAYCKESDPSTVYFRNYLDLIDTGFCPCDVAMKQPFDINHKSAGTYVVSGGLKYEPLWGGVLSRSATSVVTCTSPFSRNYEFSKLHQANDMGVILLAEPAFHAIDKILRRLIPDAMLPDVEDDDSENPYTSSDEEEQAELESELLADNHFMNEIMKIVEGLVRLNLSTEQQEKAEAPEEDSSNTEDLTHNLESETNIAIPQTEAGEESAQSESFVSFVETDETLNAEDEGLEVVSDPGPGDAVQEILPIPHKPVFNETMSFILHRDSKPEFV